MPRPPLPRNIEQPVWKVAAHSFLILFVCYAVSLYLVAFLGMPGFEKIRRVALLGFGFGHVWASRHVAGRLSSTRQHWVFLTVLFALGSAVLIFSLLYVGCGFPSGKR